MAEFSLWWTTNAAGSGDQVATYSQEHLATISAILAACNGFEGVAPGYLSDLALSSPANNTLRVAPGGALVDGRVYENDSNNDLVIPSSSGGGNVRTDRVVLRADWSAFTVRLHRIANSGDNLPAPAITQNSGTLYDIPLCQVTVDSGGILTITNERQFSVPQVDNSTIETNLGLLRVKDAGITAAKIANRTRKFFVPAVGAEDSFNQPIERTSSLGYNIGSSANPPHVSWANFFVPVDFASGMTVKPLLTSAVSAAGNIWAKTVAAYAASGQGYNTHSQDPGYGAMAVGLDLTQTGTSLALSSVAQGDFVRLTFDRDRDHASDTYSGLLYFAGWLVEYTADS